MVDTNAVREIAEKTMNIDTIAIQTTLIAVMIALWKAVEKWGPLILGVLIRSKKPEIPQDEQPYPKRINGHPCGFHEDLTKAHEENTVDLRALKAAADQHHREQRDDMIDLKRSIQEGFDRIWVRSDEHGQRLARHEERISIIKEEVGNMRE